MSSIFSDAKSKAFALADVYGHKLGRPVVYTQGVALTERLALHRCDGSYPDPRAEIEEITQPYVDSQDAIFGGKKMARPTTPELIGRRCWPTTKDTVR